MAAVTVQYFMICSLVTLACANSHSQGFLASGPQAYTNTDAVKSKLTGILSEALGHGHGVTEDRLQQINATLLPIFRSLPKNNRGHVSEPLMRYALRRYFRSKHAWIVKGFEEHADNALNASNSDMDILQGKVPDFVWSALQQKFAHQGFSLHDMLSMIAVVESLAFNELARSLEASYHMNSFESSAILAKAEMEHVLSAFLIHDLVEGVGGQVLTVEQFMRFKQNPYEFFPTWATFKPFLMDISDNYAFGRKSISNPFTAETFALEDLVRMAGMMLEEYGFWDSWECNEMKDRLSGMDVHETGRVKISDFWRAARDDGATLWESKDYLRQLGALDESSKYLGPQVIIPNYIAGMNNCITSHQYFHICCPNECDLIWQHIESELPFPNATVSQILQAVESLLTLPVISQKMVNKLEAIATIHSGHIPLHGRLFAQWLHFAFPHDCPYPHAIGSLSPKPPSAHQTGSTKLSHDELTQRIQAHTATASRDPSPDAGVGMWNFEESIVEFSTPSDIEDADRGATLSMVLRVGIQVVLVASFGALLLQKCKKMFDTFTDDAKQNQHTV